MTHDLATFRVKPVEDDCGCSEFSMPHGTVTVVINRPKGLMEIFAELEPDALDWELACGLIDRMGLTGQAPRANYLKGVDVWRIQLRPELRSAG